MDGPTPIVSHHFCSPAHTCPIDHTHSQRIEVLVGNTIHETNHPTDTTPPPHTLPKPWVTLSRVHNTPTYENAFELNFLETYVRPSFSDSQICVFAERCRRGLSKETRVSRSLDSAGRQKGFRFLIIESKIQLHKWLVLLSPRWGGINNNTCRSMLRYDDHPQGVVIMGSDPILPARVPKKSVPREKWCLFNRRILPYMQICVYMSVKHSV